jgi:hypothetical protein
VEGDTVHTVEERKRDEGTGRGRGHGELEEEERSSCFIFREMYVPITCKKDFN